MKLVLVRHFMTKGNSEGRYIGGRTDEGILAMQKKDGIYPEVEAVYISPMLRCKQTSKCLYPKCEPILIEGFRECDFGIFENKNYKELSHDPRYQDWVNQGGKIAFPEGEDPMEFRERSATAFCEVIKDCQAKKVKTAALVVHGGTIMSIMERFDQAQRDFYDYQVKNGRGYVVELDETTFDEGRPSLHMINEL